MAREPFRVTHILFSFDARRSVKDLRFNPLKDVIPMSLIEQNLQNQLARDAASKPLAAAYCRGDLQRGDGTGRIQHTSNRLSFPNFAWRCVTFVINDNTRNPLLLSLEPRRFTPLVASVPLS
jgi:hypothetical protein